jgi:hypothetical protein
MNSTTLLAPAAHAERRGRAGTVARFALLGLGAAILLAGGAVAIANALFDRQVSREVAEMFAGSQGVPAGAITDADLARLPEPVQRWLRHAGVVGKERVAAVRLKMKGTMRQSADQPWMPIEAEEYYTTNPPALIWSATARPAPFMWMRIRDRYADGRGNMLIKAFSAITVGDSSGAGMDQGTLLRYLNEIMWFPSAALSDYIQWEPVDAGSAKATMSYGGTTASAVFYFDEAVAVTNMIAPGRYRDASQTYDRWEAPISAYGEFAGVKIPTKGEAVWKLDSGDLSYGRLEITEVEYNVPAQY